MTVTGPTRELACLALAHDDTGEVRCPATDEQLMRQLVEQVQALRVEVGAVEETAADRAERVGAVEDALGQAEREWATNRAEQAQVVVEYLADLGWRLAPIVRP